MRPWPPLVAMLVAVTVIAACSDDQDAQSEAIAVSTSAAPASTVPVSTASASTTTLMPPPFASRAAAATREEEWRDVPGSPARECVDVEVFQHLARRVGPNERDIVLDLRSGEFRAGNFFNLKRQVVGAPSDTRENPTYQLKIYWVGLARDSQTPIVTARSLSDPARSPIRGTASTVSGANGTFTASDVMLPAPGRWRITGASADQWGCYDVEI